MNPLIVAILVLGAVCLGLIIWLYQQHKYYEATLEIREKALDGLKEIEDKLKKINEAEIKRLNDELEKYKNQEVNDG